MINPEKVPEPGDIIYVPSIEEKLDEFGWGKKGGTATVGRVQKAGETQHLIFVIEYGAYGMWWETYLKPIQEKLKMDYGRYTRAQTL